MDVMINVKNLSKISKPDLNDVIVYDGKKWYVTTKEDILKESQNALDKALNQLKENERRFEEFQKNVAKQLLDMTVLIEKLYTNSNK